MQDRDELKIFTKKIKEKIDILNYTSMKLQEVIAQKERWRSKRLFTKRSWISITTTNYWFTTNFVLSAQGVMALDILIKNNNELITSVKRIKNVTIVALNIGVMVSFGLAKIKESIRSW